MRCNSIDFRHSNTYEVKLELLDAVVHARLISRAVGKFGGTITGSNPGIIE